ncbi:hypothetical protein DPMN_065517 [Dreissena polymorpha]|uniref:Uncharacterized protein n=1 Tax=Dreissena polymorpha TaxID=45954 RepID=A0A9D3YWM6_DREPO|nr:hypothetical protein DPMN_065517 [Dreissena polymorpha]
MRLILRLEEEIFLKPMFESGESERLANTYREAAKNEQRGSILTEKPPICVYAVDYQKLDPLIEDLLPAYIFRQSAVIAVCY